MNIEPEELATRSLRAESASKTWCAGIGIEGFYNKAECLPPNPHWLTSS